MPTHRLAPISAPNLPLEKINIINVSQARQIDVFFEKGFVQASKIPYRLGASKLSRPRLPTYVIARTYFHKNRRNWDAPAKSEAKWLHILPKKARKTPAPSGEVITNSPRAGPPDPPAPRGIRST